MRSEIFSAIAAIAIIASAPPVNAQFNPQPGGGDRREVCTLYGQTASEQHRTNLTAQCGYDGPRWSENAAAHTAWCLIFPREAAEESIDRDRLLKQCAARPNTGGGASTREEGKRAACEVYARVAVEHAEANEKSSCGFEGARWTTRYVSHHDWCMSQRRAGPEMEARTRERDLALCFAQIDDFAGYDDDCVAYARRAIHQNERNTELRCGFRGVDWTSDYDAQVKLCESASGVERLNRLQDRSRELARCRPN